MICLIGILSAGGVIVGACGEGGAGGDCEAYDQPDSSSVEVRVKNATEAPVYLTTPGGGCEFVPGYTVESADGATLIAYLDNCQQACSSAREEHCGCPACGDSGAVMVEPGGTYVDTWSGLLYEAAEMPAGCYRDASCADGDDPCLAEVVAGEPLVFVATVYPEVECNPCECAPSESGSCELPGASEGRGEPTVRKVTWQPGDSVVEIVIE